MKAIILAAGKNKGLEREVPISLIEVQGKKIIDWQLDALRDVGIAEENIIIVVGYEKEQVRKHLIGKNVILIDNDQFNETRSAYSLWLARDFCKGGFVYVNGDLLFESEILKKVLDSKYENVFAFDRKYDFTSDMHKVVMIGDRIIHHNHRVSSDIAHGEAVGPVKVCKEFAAEVLNMIDADVSVGRMKNTIYNVFNDIAKYIPIYGANITGLRWCEVDTTEDLELAQKMFGEKTPFVVLMYGYPATGKTTMSRALQEYCSQFGRTSLISTFNLREELGLVDLYSVDERTAIYSEMMERVTKVMSWKKSNVILDGNFNKFDVRQKIYDAARKQGYQVFVVHCSVENREEINRRVEKRKSLSRNMEHGAANLNLYELIKNTTDDLSKDIMGVPQMSVIKVDTHTDAIEISQVGMMTENVSMIQNGVKLGLVKK